MNLCNINSDTLPQIPGGWTSREVSIGRHQFRLTLPADPDAFLDDPDVQAAHQRDEFMPYWPYLWPTAYVMAEAVANADWTAGTKALEIGTGIGLVGLTGLASGLDILLTDYACDAVEIALYNAHGNGFPDARGLVLDWRKPSDVRYSVIFGCDVVYENANHGPILDLLDSMLADDGLCWIGDPCRQHAAKFCQQASERGYAVSIEDEKGARLDEPGTGSFQLIVLQRA